MRYIQLFDWGWDSHGTNDQTDLRKGFADKCRQIDQPIAALLSDLKQRGLLEDTLVVWCGEFGRTPMRENRGGVDDEERRPRPQPRRLHPVDGRRRRETRLHLRRDRPDRLRGRRRQASAPHDFHATLLQLLGFDHKRLSFPFQGLDQRLSNVTKPSRVVRDIIA